MTPTKFAAWVRWKTRTTSTTFTDTNILPAMELRQDEIAKEILKVDEDILLIPQTDDLVANQREYPIPSDFLGRLKRVEAKLDETNWIPLTELDINKLDYPISTETNITSKFNNLQVSKSNPEGARFDIIRKSIYIYSGTITAVTGGLKMWCNTWPTTISSLSSSTDMSVDPSSTTHGIPRSLHEIWARGVIIDYKESREKPIPLSERELSYKLDLQIAIEALKHGNLDREVIGELPSQEDRGNEGADY